MSQICWYYAILQALIVTLILQAARNHKDLTAQIHNEKGQINTIKPKPIIKPPINCIDKITKNNLKQLLREFQINIYGSGFDPVIDDSKEYQNQKGQEKQTGKTEQKQIKRVNIETKAANQNQNSHSNTQQTRKTTTTTTTTTRRNEGKPQTKTEVEITQIKTETGKPQQTHHEKHNYATPV